MQSKRLGLRAIGLCLTLAGLMAVGVGVAQAETGSYWLVNGVKVTTLLPTLVGALENNHGTLLGEIGNIGIHILCTGAAAVGGHLLAEGGLLGTLLFSGCKFLRLKTLGGATEVLSSCAPPGGHITTAAGKGLIRLHSGTPIVVVEPKEGTTFVTIAMGEECAFGEQITINGKLAIKDCENAFLTDQVTHLIEEFASLTELYINGNKANKVTFDGSANLSLAGAHKGLTMSGHPA